jgi:hypothetical protein
MTLQKTAINRALQALENLGCSYYVVTADGEVFGELPNQKKAKEFKHGDITAYFKPFLVDLKPGQVGCVPIEKFTHKNISSSMSAWCQNNWGKGSYTYERCGNEFHLLRIL